LAFGLLFFSLSAKLDSLYLYRKLIELYTLKPFFSTYGKELSHKETWKNYTQKQALEPLKTAQDGVDASRTDIKRARKRAAISVCINIILAFGLYQLRSGMRLHSIALEADARDYLAGGLSTAVVVMSLIGAYFGLRLDRWAAGAVSVFVFWSGGQLLLRAVRDLMKEAGVELILAKDPASTEEV